MFTEALLLLLASLNYINANELSQPEFLTVRPDGSLTIDCKVSYSVTSDHTGWIRHPAGKPLDWIGFIDSGGRLYYKDSLKSNFNIIRDTSSNTVTLKGNNMQAQDTAVYYCAKLYRGYFDYWGKGTQVTVSSAQPSGPQYVFGLSEYGSGSDGFLTVGCIAKGFSPADSLTFKWTNHKGQQVNDFVQYPTIGREGGYTKISHLRVKKSDYTPDKPYKCEAGNSVDKKQAIVAPIVKCNPVEVTTLHHGKVQCYGPNGNYSYDSVCEYSCKEGYELKGSNKRKCTATKQWTGTPPTCEPFQCSELTTPNNGAMKCYDCNGKFSYKSTCEFACNEGYTLRTSSSSTLFCGATGHWNDSQPSCEIIQCKPEDIPTPDHSCPKCSGPNGNYSYDSVCEYSCKEGYELKEPKTTKCAATTKWTGTPPTCELVKCPEDATTLHDGSVNCSGPNGNFSYNAVCKYSCEESYKLKGSNMRKCTANKQWTGTPPTCEQPDQRASVYLTTPTNEELKSGTATFICLAKHFSPEKHSFKWFYGDVEVKSEGKIDECVGKKKINVTLFTATSILQLKADHWTKPAHKIKCVFEHKAGNEMKEQSYTVSSTDSDISAYFVPPSWEDMLKNKGGILTCRASGEIGFNKMEIQIKESKRVISTSSDENMADNNTVEIGATIGFEEWSNGTEFLCIINHKFRGQPTTIVYVRENDGHPYKRPSVYILAPPEQREGESVTLTCYVKDFYPMEVFVSWLADDEPLLGYTQNTSMPILNDKTYSVYSQLTLDSSKWKNGTVFSCVVYHETIDETLKVLTRSITNNSDKPSIFNLSMNIPAICKG